MTAHADFDEIRDITIIGAGPVGLSTAFWAGMREASSRIVDSLPELGGQLTTLYPEKWIFDVPGHRRILAKDLVAELREQALGQFDVPGAPRDHRARDRLRGRPRRAQDRQAATCARARSSSPAATAPSSPRSCRVSDVDMTPVGGPRRELPRRREAGLRGQARGDRRRRRLRLRLGREPARHRGGDHARAPPRRLPRPRGDGRRRSWATSTPAASTSRCPTSSRASRATAAIEAVELHHADGDSVERLGCDAVLLQLGFSTKLGPLKDWGFEIQKGALVVDGLMRTSLDRVWACGDITTFDGKLKLIATGLRGGGDRGLAGRPHDPPGHADPAGLLDEQRRARRRRGPGLSDAHLRRADPVLAALIDDFGGPLPDGAGRARPARGPLRRARAHDRGPAALGARGARDLAQADRALRRPHADAAGDPGRRSRRRCAPPRASRAPRSSTCARSPSTWSPASSSSTASPSCPTRR